MAYSPPPTGAVLEPLGTATTSIVPQYTTEGQDIISRGGTAESGSLVNGVGFSTTIANPAAITSTANTGSTITFSTANAATVIAGMLCTGPGVTGIAVSSVNYSTGVVTLASGTPTGGSYTFTYPSGGISVTTLTASTSIALTLASTSGGPVGPNYYASGLQTVLLGSATVNYTPTTPGSQLVNGMVSQTNSATVNVGTKVIFPLVIPDVQWGASISRGDGGSLGSTDWGTTLCNLDNDLAGLIPQGVGFVPPIYNDGIYGGLQWSTNSGTGITPTGTGSPIVMDSAISTGTVTNVALTSNVATITVTTTTIYYAGQTVTIAGLATTVLNGTWNLTAVTNSNFVTTSFTFALTHANISSTADSGTVTSPNQAFPSSLLVTSASTVPADTHAFRRVLLFFEKQTNGDGITFATTGVVKSSGTIDTNGSGLAVWDSGDLGWNAGGTFAAAGTGITATWHTHVTGSGGAGVILVGALYIQSSGINGVVNVNCSKSGVSTYDYSGATSGFTNLLTFLATMGMPARRVITGDPITNDSFHSLGSATQAITNMTPVISAIQTASPLSQVVLMATYNPGTSGYPGVGNTAWANTWVPAIQQLAVTSGATLVDLYARFGDLSYLGDPFGLTTDNAHMGTQTGTFPSTSGRNGQQALAEAFFEKLVVSNNFALSGTTTSGTAADGKIVNSIGVGNSSGVETVTGWYYNANDANPRAAVVGGGNALAPSGLYTGPGGASMVDTYLYRSGAGQWTSSALEIASGAGLGLGKTSPTVTGTRSSVPPTQATIATTLGSVALGTALQNTLSYDVRLVLYIPVTASTNGTILVGVGTTNAPTQVTVVAASTLTGIIQVSATIPANQYILVSKGGTSTVGTPVTYWEAA